MAAMTNYLENKLVDHVLRGVPYTAPTTTYAALLLAVPGEDGVLVEVTGAGYARVAITSNTINWSGTQGAGSTTASTGTSGTISNNTIIAFPAPAGNWGTVVAVALKDAATGGNTLLQGALVEQVIIDASSPAPRFPASTFEYQIDN